MTIADEVRTQGGVVRVRCVRDAGWSERAVRAAVDGGQLVRPRKGWVAVPGADPMLVAAARDGVVLSCVTAAVRLGLWVLDAGDRPHVAANPRSGGVSIRTETSTGRRRATVHWGRPVVPRHPNALVDPVENVLAPVAGCLPREQALAIWESALDRRLVTLPELRRLPYRGRARDVREAASPFSDSGLETFIPVRLAWLGLPIVQQVWICGHRVDALIGERLVLQADGGSHIGQQRELDNAHDAQLMLLGYHVIRVGYDRIVNHWHEVQDLVTRAVAQGLHLER